MSGSPSHLGIVALPFEVSTTLHRGTVHGPAALLDELEQLDDYDLSLARAPFRGVSRTVVSPHGPELVDPKIQQAVAGRVVGELLDGDGFPLSIGGEHTVALGPIRAARARGELGVVQLDAHADLRDTYEDNPLSHACVMRRVHEMECDILGVGIRSLSEDEARFVQEQGVRHVDARTADTRRDWWSLVEDLPDRVYLTVDLDVFDPADAPAVGTPEPGGPGWDPVCDFLAYLFTRKDVIGADIVELLPGPGDEASVRLAARLAGLIVGLRFPDLG